MRVTRFSALMAWPLAMSLVSIAEGDGEPPAKAAGLETVIIVYKTHFDIGYTTLAREVIHEYRTDMVDRVLDAIRTNRQRPKDEQFVWTLSGWPMKQMLWEGQSPERREAIEGALREGNLAVHAFPFTTHTETAEPEDLVRGLNISSTLCRRYGLPLSTGAKMTDVPGQSWILPTLFAHAGIKFYHMGGPLVNRTFGLPPMFWWEGPDGSRLLTLYRNDYGTPALPPEGWPYRTWIYISMTGDNQGPPDPGTVTRDIAFYRSRGISAKVGRLDDFAERILAEDLTGLPVVRSDITDPWIHGTLSMPEACKLAHGIRPLIGALDALTTLERCWGIPRPGIVDPISRAYEESLLFSEHTWGLANQHYVKQPYGEAWDELWARGLPSQYGLMEASWREKAGHVHEVERLVAGPYADAVLALADAVAVPGGRIVVHNPLAWQRDGEVTLNVFHLPHGVSLKPIDGGPPIPISHEGPAVEDPYRVIRFIAKGIPPMGYRTYAVSSDEPPPAALAADEKTGIIESPHFRAAVDAQRGRISSLIDKRSGRELVDAAAPHGFGQYLHERFGHEEIAEWTANSLYPQYEAHKMIFSAYDLPKDSVYSSSAPRDMKLSVRRTPIDVSATLTGSIPGPGPEQRVYIRLTLPAALPAADLEIGWQKQPDSWPEAGWICLPFKCANPRFRLGRLGADMDPVKDLTVDHANYHLSWIHTGAAVYDGDTGAGVAVCPRDSPLVSLGEPGEYKFDRRYEPKLPYIYVNLYNNHWRTNFAGWIGDGRRMVSRVRIWAFDRFDPESALYSPSMEARVPLAAARSTARPGKLPPMQAGISLSRKGVAITAFGPNPDGPGTVLRLWEQGGRSGRLVVTLPGRFETAEPINLRGERLGPSIPIRKGELQLDLGAYAPASFLLR